MAAYVGARLVQLLALLFIISLLTFVLMRGLLGDPVLMILGPDASVDQATVQRLRHELLLDQPIHVQYLEWLRRAAVADFGRSLRTPISVHDALIGRLPVTIELSIEALLVALLLAVPIGVQAGARPERRLNANRHGQE